MNNEYIKDYESWGKYSKILDSRDAPLRFYSKEIWWCALGVNIGSEQDGKNNYFERPVLIIKRLRKDLILIIPITSSIKDYSDRVNLVVSGQESQLLLEHIRVISSKRLLRKISMIKLHLYLRTILVLIRTLSIAGIKSETPH